MAEKIFADGFFIEKKEGSPEWLKGSVSIQVSKAIAFLELYEKKSGYVNLDLKESVGGKLYLELNTWVPKDDKTAEEEDNQEKLNNIKAEEMDAIEYPEEDTNNEEIPF